MKKLSAILGVAGIALTISVLSAHAGTDYYPGYQWADSYPPWAAEAFEGGK